jgi:uncharacterized protein involved in exopolysaccharide biosynthesis
MSDHLVESSSPTAIILLFRVARKRWRFVSLVVAAFVVLAMAWSLLSTPIYQASVTVLPSNENANYGLIGSLLDIPALAVGSTGGNEALYAKILTSEEVLSEIIDQHWNYRGSPQAVSLYEIYGVDERRNGSAPSPRARAELLKKLRDEAVTMNRDKSNGFMNVQVRVPRDPVLAAALANALVDRLDRFNIDTSTSRASRQLRFLQDRLQEVRRELSRAEDELVAFVEGNRAYRESPLLLQRYQRLSRDVEASNAVWVELRRQVELTRLEEQRDLSTLDILDRAAAPPRPITPNLRLNLLVAVCLGLTVALAGVQAGIMRRTGAL